MLEVSSVNVLKLYDFFENEVAFFFVMEYLPEGNLLNYIVKEKDGIQEVKAKNIFGQMLAGLYEINKKGYLHRDLKPENILLAKGPKGEETFKICDFGFSKPLNSEGIASTYCGTEEFMAPEIHEKKKYNYKVIRLFNRKG